jgi:hypothetical protein
LLESPRSTQQPSWLPGEYDEEWLAPKAIDDEVELENAQIDDAMDDSRGLLDSPNSRHQDKRPAHAGAGTRPDDGSNLHYPEDDTIPDLRPEYGYWRSVLEDDYAGIEAELNAEYTSARLIGDGGDEPTPGSNKETFPTEEADLSQKDVDGDDMDDLLVLSRGKMQGNSCMPSSNDLISGTTQGLHKEGRTGEKNSGHERHSMNAEFIHLASSENFERARKSPGEWASMTPAQRKIWKRQQTKQSIAEDEATIGVNGEGAAVPRGGSATLQGSDDFGGINDDLGRSESGNSFVHIGEELPENWHVWSKNARRNWRKHRNKLNTEIGERKQDP